VPDASELDHREQVAPFDQRDHGHARQRTGTAET
jgi:hypothetical protein